MPLEYRVRWRREDRQRTTKIFQTAEAARRKAQGILALEEVKEETSLAGMPALVEPPVIQEREVSEWRSAEIVPLEITEKVRENVRMHFAPDDTSSGWGEF